MRAGEAALEQHGLAHAADALEQLEVLHVARADLDHVDVLHHQVGLRGRGHLGHHPDPDRVAHLGQDLEPAFLHPLERVGRGARLEGAAAEEGRPGLLDLARDRERLLEALDRTGAGDHGDVLPADGHVAHAHLGVLRVHRAADQLVGGLDADDGGHAREALQLLFVHPGFAENADPFHVRRRQFPAVAAFGPELADQLGLAFSGQVLVQFQDHGSSPLGDRPCKNAKPREAVSGLPESNPGRTGIGPSGAYVSCA